MCHSSKKTSQLHTSTQHKVVEEVQAQEDQNTGKAKNVNIIDMVRSTGLHAKSANVQEMSIIHDLSTDENPVFYTPVQSQVVPTTWENCQNIMEPEVCVATPVEHCIFEMKQINVITVHDMELISAHYSNVSINGQIVQVKQDTGAEVNVMPKSMFEILSTSNTTKLLNKAKSMKIS